MALINLMSVGVAVGVGAADEFLERRDNEAGRVDFKRWSNLARLLGSLGGYAMQVFDFYPNIGRDLAQSATPLLTKSVTAKVLEGISSPVVSRAARFARASSTGRSTGAIPDRVEI